MRQSLNRSLLRALTGAVSHHTEERSALRATLRTADLERMEAVFKALFAGIPYQWHVRNDMAHYEAWFGSVFYSAFQGVGVGVQVEDSSASGRVDLRVKAYGQIYLFEFKVVERATQGAALAQLLERDYAAKYRAGGQPIHLIGVECSEEARTIIGFETASRVTGGRRVRARCRLAAASDHRRCGP